MRRELVLLIAAALAGCQTVGPSYHRPPNATAERPTANQPFVSGNSKAFAPAPVPADWWRLYGDPVLDRLIAEALVANTDLRVAAANIERARAARDVATDARTPQVDLSAGVQYGHPSAEEYLQFEHVPNAFLYSTQAAIAYQVDLVGQIRRTIEAADADLAATQAAYDSVRVSAVAGTTAAYLDACSAGHEIAVARHALALQQRTTVLVRRLLRAGRGIPLDVTRSAAQEANVRATLPSLLAAKQVALFRLAALTGRPPADLDQNAAACAAEPRLSRAIPIGDGAALIRRRPDIRQAEWQLHAATARIGVAEGELYPSISLGAGVGSLGLANDAFRPDTNGFSIGPLIRWSFPNRGRVRARIRGAQAEADAAYARFDGTVLTALRETETALTVYAHDLDRAAALRQVREEAARAASDAERLFRAGRTGFLPVLDAERTEVNAEQGLAMVEGKLVADQVALFLALGGGWEGSGQPTRPGPQAR